MFRRAEINIAENKFVKENFFNVRFKSLQIISFSDYFLRIKLELFRSIFHTSPKVF